MPRGIYEHKPNQGLQKGHKLNVGKKFSEEHRKNLSISKMGNTCGFKKGNKINLGRNTTDKTKKKIGNGNRGKKRTEQWKKEKSEAMKLKKNNKGKH